MKKVFSKKTSYAIIAVVLVLSMVGGYFLSDSNRVSAGKKEITAKERILAKRQEVLSSSLKMNTEADENEVVRAIISLKGKSVADTNKVSKYNSKLKSKENKIINNQNSLIKKVEKITGNKVKNQSAYLVNSFSIDATRKQMKKIVKLDGVEKVYEATKYKTTMASAVKEGNVQSQLESEQYGYTGEGTVIAVIDTGVNYRHQDMVLDSGVSTKFTKEQWKEKIKLLGHGTYMTDKVPFGYDYTTGKNECLNKGAYHGYHVSGIASGNGTISGVAKNAQVLGLKVFGDGFGGCYSDDVVAAIEDAVKLGADIINMSLGGDCALLTDEDYMATAVNNATKEGIISCISAGNSGTSAGLVNAANYLDMNDTATVASPSVATSSLSVASADNVVYKNECSTDVIVGKNNIHLNFVDLVGYGFEFDNVKLVNVGYGVNENKKLTVKEKKIKDKIAVVQEGVSTLNDKIYYLSKAGAKGIVIVSEKENIDANVTAKDWFGVPVMLVSSSDGDILKTAAKKKYSYKTVNTEVVKESNSDVHMSYFSSWGPTNELTIKPEIAAPGGKIKAALDGTDNYAVYSGTSMASPFIAGSEAVMLSALKARGIELKGEELVKFLKNSLMNTADPIIDKSTNYPYSVRYQGSGLVDVYGAVDNNVLATCNGDAKVELKEISGVRTFDITLKNYGKTDATYILNNSQIYTNYTENKTSDDGNINVNGIKPVVGAKIIYNMNKVTVPAGQTVTVTANISLAGKMLSNQFVEAFIQFEGQGVQNIGMPVLGFYGDYDAEPIVDKSVYEEGKSFLEEKIDIEALTALADTSSGEYDGILGQEFSKVMDKESNSSTIETKAANKEEIEKCTRKAISCGLVDGKEHNKESAIDVNIGDTVDVPIINSGESTLYRIKANKDIGCTVDFKDISLEPAASVYSEDMELLSNSKMGYTNDQYFPLQFSMKKGTVVYVDIENLSGETGIVKTEFKEEEYDEDNDVEFFEEEAEEKAVTLKENRKMTFKRNDIRTAIFTPKKDSYYTFEFTDIKVPTYIEIYKYIYNNSGEMADCEYLYSGNACGEYSREFKLNKGSQYVISLDNEVSEISKVIAKLKVKASNGDNAYTITEKYNGNNSAFSPNNDDMRDSVAPVVTQLRNAKTIKATVLDSNKNVIKTLASLKDLSKSTYLDLANYGVGSILYSYIIGDQIEWDGTVYNKATGESEVVEDGQYFIQLEIKRTEDSEAQIITMPVKVDTVEPELTMCDIRTKRGETIIEFNVKDNLAMSPYYYIDIQQQSEDNEEYGEASTFGKLYEETTVNEAGNYELNLGKIKNADITLAVEDAAGNQVMSENSADDIESEDDEDIDYDMEDSDEDSIEGFKICDGVILYHELSEGIEMGAANSEGSLFIEGECEKDITIEINGQEVEYENDEYFIEYLSKGKYFNVEVPIEESANTTTINFVAKKAGKEIFNETYNVTLDRVAPKINVLENSAFDKIKPMEQFDEVYVLLNDTVKDELTFRIKIEDTNLNEESLDITGLGLSYENITYKKLDDGTYEIALTDIDECEDCEDYIEVMVDISDMANNNVCKNIYFIKDLELFESWSEMTAVGFSTNLDEENVINSSMLNEDGTFTLSGDCAQVPQDFTINGEKVCVNPRDLTFEHKINVQKGRNNINIDIKFDGEYLSVPMQVLYEDANITFNNMPKTNKDGVIVTKNEVFNLSGTITSYASVASIDINGDNLYIASDVKTSLNGKALTKKFDYNIKLQKGTNIIQITAKTYAGTEITKTITVEYK